MTLDSAKIPGGVAREWWGNRRGRGSAGLFSDAIRHFSKPDLRLRQSFPLFAALQRRAGSPSGKARLCKSCIVGSIPTLASNERSWIPQGFIKAQPPKGREQGQNGGRERFLNCGPRSGVRLGRPQTRQDSTQVAEPHGRFLGQPNRCIQNRKSFPGPDAPPPMPPMPDTLLGLLGRIHCQNGEVQFS